MVRCWSRAKAAVALISIFVAGCSGPNTQGGKDSSSSGTPSPSDTFAEQIATIKEKTADWNDLKDFEFPMLTESTKRFNFGRLQGMENAEAAIMREAITPRIHISNDAAVAKTVAAAPGKLQVFMERAAADDKRKSKQWAISFATNLDKGWSVAPGGRTTSGWRSRDVKLRGNPAVEVSLSTRTVYMLSRDSDKKVFPMVIVRWINLTTMDPDYAKGSGDYSWTVNVRGSSADMCSYTGGRLAPRDDRTIELATADTSADSSEVNSRALLSPPNTYVDLKDFDLMRGYDKEIQKYQKACDSRSG